MFFKKIIAQSENTLSYYVNFRQSSVVSRQSSKKCNEAQPVLANENSS